MQDGFHRCQNCETLLPGQNCTTLQHLDITGSADVTDVGIQNLVFPLAIQKAGRVNLVNTRARTNPPAKQLHTVVATDTAVDTTGCIILLQFCPRLTKARMQGFIILRAMLEEYRIFTCQ